MTTSRLLFLMAALLAGPALAQQTAPPAPPAPAPAPAAIAPTGGDRTFMAEAMRGNLAEIQLARLAATKAQNEEVKAYARTLEADHAKANEAAKTVAGADITGQTTAPTAEQQQEFERMQAASGAAFDKAFIEHAVQDHRKDIEKYQKAAGGSSATAAYARQVLPDLQKHLLEAERLSKAIAGTR